MSAPSKHADLLNRLDQMQAAPYYATAKATLAAAERVIVEQEKRINDLEVLTAPQRTETDDYATDYDQAESADPNL